MSFTNAIALLGLWVLLGRWSNIFSFGCFTEKVHVLQFFKNQRKGRERLRERDEWEERICNGIISLLRIGTKMVCF